MAAVRRESTKLHTRRDHVRSLLGALCLASVTVGFASSGLPAAVRAAELPRLYVFVNSVDKPRALQRRLETRMPRVDVTVFGRYRDFESALAEIPPDAVIASRLVLDELGFSPALQGTIGSDIEEPYALLSIARAVAPQNVRTVGSVDLLGRARMKRFVAETMNTGSPPKVKLVTKTEDLLPLLQFGVADAVLLPVRHVGAIVRRSELTLVSKVLPTKVGVVAAAGLSAEGAAILDIVRSLDASTSKAMGAEQWQ